MGDSSGYEGILKSCSMVLEVIVRRLISIEDLRGFWFGSIGCKLSVIVIVSLDIGGL